MIDVRRWGSAFAAIALVWSPVSAAEGDPVVTGEGTTATATLASNEARMSFRSIGGKCVSLIVGNGPKALELTDATGIFEDHLVGQSYLASDFRRAAFSMTVRGAALVLTADAISPAIAGLRMTKTIGFASPTVVRCEIAIENHGNERREVALWHHQALHTKDGTTAYTVPTERGIQRLAYDPKATPSETWFRTPSRPWIGAAFGAGDTAHGAAFTVDWPVLDHLFVYRSDLYATVEWRTIAKALGPGEVLKSQYALVLAPGATSVDGVLGTSIIDASAKPARIIGPDTVRTVAVRAASERLVVPAGTVAGNRLEIALPRGYGPDDVVVVVSGDGDGDAVAEFQPTGKPFTMEPQPGRLGAAKKLPPGRADILYTLDAPIPFTAWAKPYYRGTVKAWILGPMVPQGDTIHLLKRFDIDYDIVSCDWSWEMNTWGMGDFYGGRSAKADNGRDREFGYATEDLTSDRHYDVMIVPTFIGWNQYPEKMRQAIVRRVEAGAGLVLINPQDCAEKPADGIALPALSPFTAATPTKYHWYGDWQRAEGAQEPKPWTVVAGHERHPILSGVGWSSMPFSSTIATQNHQLAPGATALVMAGTTPAIAIRSVGKGRVVGINWHSGNAATLTPIPDESKCPSWDYWEQFYNLLGRATLYAADRSPEFDVTVGELSGQTVAITVDNRSRDLDALLQVVVKDERGTPSISKEAAASLPKGSSQHRVDLGRLPGGTVTIEVIARSGPNRLGWGSGQATVPRAGQISSVTIAGHSAKNGDTVTGHAVISGKAAGSVRIELRDPHGRVLGTSTADCQVDGETTVPFSFRIDQVLSLVVSVRAQLVVDGITASEKDSADLIVTPAEPSFTDYEVIPWRFDCRRTNIVAKTQAFRRFNATASDAASPAVFRAGMIVKGDAAPPQRTLGVYFFDNEKGRLEDVWAKYKESGDKSTLVRSVCLADPAILKGIDDEVRKKVVEQRGMNPGTYMIGDESSLTCYTLEADLDFNPLSIAAFRTWLAKRYPDIAALNAKWQTSFADFADILPFTIIEVEKDAAKACGWAEHRTFMEEQYEGVLARMRAVARSEDPNAELELSGTQSTTSFNGMDWVRVSRHVKRYVPYNINFMYDQLRSFNPGVRSAALTGYGSVGDGVKNSLWNQALHGLLSANIFWEWSLVDADLTTSTNAEDIGEVFRELRGRGIGRMIGATTWTRSPVAIAYSIASIHAARIQKREGLPADCRNAWCQVTRDLGLQFDMLSYAQIEDGGWLQNAPQVLVLPALFAPSAAESARILSYVEAGGTVIADIDPGICDERCDFRVNRNFEKLFGDGTTAGTRQLGTGTAILLAKSIADYNGLRGKKEGAEMSSTIAKLFADAGAKPTVPITVGGQPLARAETIVMERGPWKVLAILKENLTGIRKTTPDGVEYFEPLPAGQAMPMERIAASLPVDAHVYDIRARKYLGKRTTIDDDLRSAEAKLYALLPYRVTGVTVSTKDRFAPGTALRCDISVGADGGQVGDHVLNIRAVDASGAELAWYARNILAEKGKATITLPVELNPAGPFILVVTDVLSGTQGTHDFSK
ncbi:MAG: beta-galactosidase [Planctomycetes bacterium]|nr:beta-galactosidase [Planctomycetota bacterium]